MKFRYFFRPIARMFDFKGVSGRAEYFMYAISSAITTSIVFLFLYIFSILNWTAVLEPEMLDEYGYPLWLPVHLTVNGIIGIVLLMQFPMIALTVRRLRDQYANPLVLLWIFFPPALFFYGFVPTFKDYPVRLPDGSEIMRSEQIRSNRIRNAFIGAGVLIGGTAAATTAMGNSVSGMRLEGGPKMGPVKGGAFKADGSINNSNNILGGRKSHYRNGRSVSGSRNKYTK